MKYMQSVQRLAKNRNETARCFNVFPELSVAKSEAGDTRRLFLAYLHCLYEANRQDLLVKPIKLTSNLVISFSFTFYRFSVHDLNVFSLLDLGRICYPSSVGFVFNYCFLSDHAIELAATTLTNRAHTYHQSTNVELYMGGNNFTHERIGVQFVIYLMDYTFVKI